MVLAHLIMQSSRWRNISPMQLNYVGGSYSGTIIAEQKIIFAVPDQSALKQFIGQIFAKSSAAVKAAVNWVCKKSFVYLKNCINFAVADLIAEALGRGKARLSHAELG